MSKKCIKCGAEIPTWVKIGGKNKNLSSRKYCLDCKPFKSKEFVPNKRWQRLPEVIKECNSIADVIRSVGLSDKGNNHQTAKKVIEYYKLDTTHFGEKPTKHKIREDEEIFTIGPIDKRIVKSRLLERVEYECGGCGIREWNGKPITLQLDHINGNNSDNRLKNLRLLCPNCHSQTETWGSKKRD